MKPGDKITIERLDDGSYSIEANGVVHVGDASTAAVCLNKAVFGDEANASEQRLEGRSYTSHTRPLQLCSNPTGLA